MLAVRVYMAMHKYLDKPLPKVLQGAPPATSSCPPLARDTTRRLETLIPSSSHTTPTSPQPTTTTHTVLHPTPYRPYSPPSHPPPDIPLPPIPPSVSSSQAPPPTRSLPTSPLPEHLGIATCIDIGNLAADTIDALPCGYRRIALLVFDTRHPPNGRMAAHPPLDGGQWADTSGGINQRR